MTTTRDFAREKLGRESLLARLCASADNGRCRFLTGSKSTFHILKACVIFLALLPTDFPYFDPKL